VSDVSKLDPTGAVADALAAAAYYHGVSILSNANALASVLGELAGERPVETRLVVNAAEVDIAAMINGHVSQNLDLDSAVRLSANTLSTLRPLDPDACVWAAWQFARAMGYEVDEPEAEGAEGEDEVAEEAAAAMPVASALPFGQPFETGGVPAAPIVAPEPVQETYASPETDPLSASFASSQAGGAGEAGEAGSVTGTATADHSTAEAPPAADMPSWIGLVAGEKAESAKRASERPPPTYSMPRVGPSTPPVDYSSYEEEESEPERPVAVQEEKHSRLGRFALWAVVGVVIYFAIALFAKLPPFKASSTNGNLGRPPTIGQGTGTGTQPDTTTQTTTATAVTGQLSLQQLMPDQSGGLSPSSCSSVSQTPTGFTGISSSLQCSSLPGESGWTLYGFKFSGPATYATSLQEFNFDVDFIPGAAGATCPAPESEEGVTPWATGSYPTRRDQYLECLWSANTAGSYVDTYLWTLPTQRTFFVLTAKPSASGTAVQQWWAQYGQPGT
jgi:hypothetical protein